MPKDSRELPGQYTPALWEKVVAATVSVFSFGIVAWLVIRNQPFADPNLVVLLRIVLSVAAAVLGATIPGFLYVDWKGKGLVVRAGGALALFVIAYFFSPAVVKPEEKKLGLNDIQIRFAVSAWQLTENDLSRAPKVIPCRGKIELMSIDFDLVLVEALDHSSSRGASRPFFSYNSQNVRVKTLGLYTRFEDIEDKEFFFVLPMKLRNFAGPETQFWLELYIGGYWYHSGNQKFENGTVKVTINKPAYRARTAQQDAEPDREQAVGIGDVAALMV